MATNSATQPRGTLLDRVLTSPRAQRRLTWISAFVLVAGVTAAVVTFVLHNTTSQANTLSGPPQAPAAGAGKHVKPSKNAYTTARHFLEWAVARKDLHAAYPLVGSPLKAGVSKAQWLSGDNPVIPYPVNNARTAQFHAITSTKNKLYIEMQLSATKKSNLDAFTFFMLLRKTKSGNWLVDYFEAENPYNGLPQNGGGVGH